MRRICTAPILPSAPTLTSLPGLLRGYADQMEYRPPQPVSHSDAEAAFAQGDQGRICEVLVGLAFNDPDWRWVETACVRFADRGDAGGRSVALICLSHLARIHRQLDVEVVMPVIVRELEDDPLVAGQAEDALDDLRIFLGAEAIDGYGV